MHAGDSKESDPAAYSNTDKTTPIVLDVKRDFFERILITMEMMQDHLPDSYLSVVNTL